jgi:phage I-like protein
LKGAALTNVPFIKGMEAIAASEINHDKKDKKMNLTEIKIELAEKHAIDLSDLQARALKLADAEKCAVTLSEELSAAKAKAKALESEKTELAAKVEAVEKERAELRFSDMVKKAMEEGKLTKAMAEGSFRRIYEKGGFELCEAFLSEAPKVVDVGDSAGHATGEKKTTSKKPAGVQLAELSAERAVKEKISYADAASLVLAENPELVKAYEAECPFGQPAADE